MKRAKKTTARRAKVIRGLVSAKNRKLLIGAKKKVSGKKRMKMTARAKADTYALKVAGAILRGKVPGRAGATVHGMGDQDGTDSKEVIARAPAPKPAPLPEPRKMTIAIDLIDESAHGGRSKRTEKDDAEIGELAASIASSELLQPVGLVELNGRAKGGKKYELVWGWRRVQAHKHLERKTIEAKVYPASCEGRVAELRAIENVQRSDWDLIEQALAASKMYEETPADSTGNTSHSARLRAVGDKLGKSESWVGDRVYLARLDGQARDLVKSGRLPLQQARAIATLADPVLRNDLARRCARQPDGSGGESYERVSRFCSDHRWSLKVVPWKLDTAFAGAPACDKCPSNTANDVGLFGHDPKEGKLVEEAGPLCMNQGCFERKRRATDAKIDAGVKRVRDAIKAKKISKDDLNKTEMTAAGVMPDVVKESTFVRKVKNEITPQAPSVRKGQGLATSMTDEGKRETPAQASRRRDLERFDEARDEWFNGAEVALREACKTARQRAYLELLFRFDLFKGAIGHSDSSRRKCQASPKLAVAISKLGEPTIEDFEAIAPEKPAEYDDMLAGWDARHKDETLVADLMAKALGVKLPAYPSREPAAEAEPTKADAKK